MPVGLVLVSHSRALAEGTKELAAQMAPDIAIVAAGGTDSGEIGTSFDLIGAAIASADSGAGAVVLYDLGSALLTAEIAVEFCEPDQAERVQIVDAPLVEGALAAAVAAQSGAGLAAVARAARDAGGLWIADTATDFPNGGPAGAVAGSADSGVIVEVAAPRSPRAAATVRLRNPLGLHARPVAALARQAAGLDAEVRMGRPGGPAVELRSAIALVGLALRGGEDIEVSAGGPDAVEAVHAAITLIETGFGEAEQAPAAPIESSAVSDLAKESAPSLVDGILTATPGAPGLALGSAHRLNATPGELPSTAGSDPTTEGSRLDLAIAAAGHKLAVGNEFAQAHAAMLADPDLRRAAESRLADGAAAAWWSAISQLSGQLASSPDELISARAVDLREAGAAVLAELGVVLDRIPEDGVIDGAVVLTDDIGPAEVTALAGLGCRAVVLAGGSRTAHAVIVAGGLGLPMVLQTGALLDDVASGDLVAVDGSAGRVTVNPEPEAAQRIRGEITSRQAAAEALRAAAQAPVTVSDGRTVLVAANVGSVADAELAVRNGADAVGLLRTEMLVLDRDVYPTEDEQRADLVAILRVLGDRPVVIRVLDAGGDKPVATLDVDAEHNGFLGVRGLRYLLAHPDLLHTQLRAICRAAVGHRVWVMAPMVTIATEAAAFRRAVARAVESLAAEGTAHASPEAVGVMVEVPAAALAADELCPHVDFLSVGTNDLTGYTTAADRTEPGVAGLIDPGSTAVQRLLDQLCAHAAAAGIPVAVCGEMAGMAEFVPGLVDRGVMELSMAPARIPEIKAVLRDSLG